MMKKKRVSKLLFFFKFYVVFIDMICFAYVLLFYIVSRVVRALRYVSYTHSGSGSFGLFIFVISCFCNIKPNTHWLTACICLVLCVWSASKLWTRLDSKSSKRCATPDRHKVLVWSSLWMYKYSIMFIPTYYDYYNHSPHTTATLDGANDVRTHIQYDDPKRLQTQLAVDWASLFPYTFGFPRTFPPRYESVRIGTITISPYIWFPVWQTLRKMMFFIIRPSSFCEMKIIFLIGMTIEMFPN